MGQHVNRRTAKILAKWRRWGADTAQRSHVTQDVTNNPEDKKPADQNEEKRVVDAEAKKPEDWDDEMKGQR